MYLVLKEEIKDDLNRIFVYISATISDKDTVEQLCDYLANNDFEYYVSYKNEDYVTDDMFANLCREKIKDCSCAIMFLNNDIIQNSSLYNFFIFEAGLLQGYNKGFYPFLNVTSLSEIDKYLNKSPIRNVQMTNDIKQIFSELNNYNILDKNIYKNDLVDKHSRKRIRYVKLVVMLEIKYFILKSIYQRIAEIADLDNEFEVLNFFEKDLVIGARVIRFGREDMLKAERYWPYEDEMVLLEEDYPKNNLVNRLKIVKQMENRGEINDNEVSAIAKIEFIVPNHDVLGVSFKPYIDLKQSVITPNDIISILNSNDVKDQDIVKTKMSNHFRFYFNLDLSDEQMVTVLGEDEQKKYGHSCNYLFPK
ncbi:MAG TPA: hypothetical protein VIK84_00030 [Haloplasmataceae bacterium]